jgi:hypothetical protein
MLHLMFADMVIDLGAPGRSADPPLRWFADWLPDGRRKALDRRQLDRINAFSCSGPSPELHELLRDRAAVKPAGMVRGSDHA